MEGRVFDPKTGTAYDVDDVDEAEKKGYISAKVVGPDDKEHEMETIDDFKDALRKGYHVPHVAALLNEADKRNAPNLAVSTLRGAAQSATGGFADEISAGVNSNLNKLIGGETDYKTLRDEYRKGDDLAWKENPTGYGAGYVGMMIPALGASGANLLRVAAKPTVAGIGARLGEGATLSSIGGVGSADELKDVDTLRDAELGAGISMVPNVLGGLKKLIPGTEKSLPSVNKLTTKVAGVFGMTPETQPTYQKFLDDPKSYDVAMAAREDLPKRGEEFLQKANDLVDTGKKNVSSAYSRMQDEAAIRNVEKPLQSGSQTFGEAQKDVVDAIDDARKFIAMPNQSSFYAPSTDKTLSKAQSILTNGDPKFTRWLIKKAGITLDDAADLDGRTLQKLAFAKIKRSGDVEAERMFKVQMGKLFVQSRREIDDALKGIKPGMGMTKDQQMLKEIRDGINEKAHSMLSGSKTMTEADKLYQEFTTQAEPFASSLVTKGTADPKKVVRSLQNAGGDTAQVNLEIMLNRADDFYSKNAGSFTDAEKAAYAKVREAWQKAGGPLADARNFGRMSASVGATTGRSAAGIGAIGVGSVVGGAPLAAGAALLFPALNPVTWLAMLQKARQMGDTKTIQTLLRAAEKGTQAVSRQAGSVSENMAESP